MNKFISPCPPPNPREREILTIIMEECAEVIQRASKALRFGLHEVQPKQGDTNIDRLCDELGDLEEIVNLAISETLLRRSRIRNAAFAKRKKLDKYMQILSS